LHVFCPHFSVGQFYPLFPESAFIEPTRIMLTGVPTFLVSDHDEIAGAQPIEAFKGLFNKIEPPG